MDLPRKWPGRVKVRQALTLMRLTGKWYPRIQDYAEAAKPFQKRRYWWFREEFYYHIYKIHPDHPETQRIGR
jgi:hypothetical protein